MTWSGHPRSCRSLTRPVDLTSRLRSAMAPRRKSSSREPYSSRGVADRDKQRPLPLLHADIHTLRERREQLSPYGSAHQEDSHRPTPLPGLHYTARYWGHCVRGVRIGKIKYILCGHNPLTRLYPGSQVFIQALCALVAAYITLLAIIMNVACHWPEHWPRNLLHILLFQLIYI